MINTPASLRLATGCLAPEFFDFPIEAPWSSIRWALWTSRSRIAVGDVRITDLMVPLSDRNLAGENRGASGIAIGADIQFTVCQRETEMTQPKDDACPHCVRTLDRLGEDWCCL